MVFLILLGAVIFGLIATVIFFFGTDNIEVPWAIFGLIFFVVVSWVALGIKEVSWETYFYGLNWIHNPEAWKWLTTPVGE